MQIRTETGVGLFVLTAIGIFLYMSFQIGSWRLGTKNQAEYFAYFKDISGLSKKADIKIAGVKVGWVDVVRLSQDNKTVQTRLMIDRKYLLHSDAYAVVRQDGLLGNKYLEIMPGDPLLPALAEGSTLAKASREQISIDEILREVKIVATNIKDVTNSLRESFGGEDGVFRLKEIVENLGQAINKIYSFSDSVEKIVSSNTDSISGIITDLEAASGEIKGVFPSLRNNIQRIADVWEDNIGSINNTTTEIKDTFNKINQGQGILGKLVTDEKISKEVQETITSLQKSLTTMDKLEIIVDGHFESMQHPNKGFVDPDAKGFVNVIVSPSDDSFYLIGVTGSNNGYPCRRRILEHWYDEKGRIIPKDILIEPWAHFEYAERKDKLKLYLDSWKYNIQIGKVYDNLSLRVGLFESTFGAGLDYNIPLDCDKLNWVSTLEAFDFRGRNRIWCDDKRVHLKWLNRVFFTSNLYFSFGADDFVSRYNKNVFLGFGLEFKDDFLKYILSKASCFLNN